MVLLTTTPRILELISSLPDATRTKLAGQVDTLPKDLTAPISHHALISLSRLSHSHVSLNTLLRGTEPYVPPPPPKPEPSPEYKALMARLHAEQERREYLALLSKQSHGSTGAEDDEEEDHISPSLVLNILLSVVFCAIAVFVLSRWLWNDGVRVLMSLATGIVVGIAEVVVYAGYLRTVREGKAKERKKKERKVFIGEYRGEGDEGDPLSVLLQDGEKEVIWGRGKHGGVRRRVQEKWEKEQQREARDEVQ